jgi:ABC-2 type transport system permease protein
MSWTRIRAMAAKEMIQIKRDSRSLLIVLVMPITLVLLFGYGVSLDLKHLPIYVYDQEGSQRSQDFVQLFAASEYFHVVRSVKSYPEVLRALDSGTAKMGIVIPWDFSEKLAAGERAPVQALVDASDDNTANVLIGYTQAVVQGYSQKVQLDWAQHHGQQPPEAPVRLDSRTWFNENLESRVFILPGVLALVMSVIGAFLTSLTIAREWERGTMEQLVSTPIQPLEIMIGKLIPYFIIGLISTAICASVVVFWFDVPIRGSLLALLVSTALFLVAVLSLGFFISVVAKNQLAASQIALMAAFLPAFLLSGFLFSIDQMPLPIRLFTRIVPARHYTTIVKDVFLKGTPVSGLYPELVALTVFALFLAMIAIRKFHKRLD